MLITHELLDEVTARAKTSPRLRMNYNFHSSPQDSVQRMLNAIEPGSIIPIQRHPNTNETLILLRGKLRVRIYTDNKTIVEECVLDIHTGNVGYHFPAGVWHWVEPLESGTILFETREGPYQPLSKDDILE